MELNKKKLVISKSNLYNYPFIFTFVKEKEDGYEMLHQPMSCKDWLHEGISNIVHNTNHRIGTNIKCTDDVNLKKLIMMFSYSKIFVNNCGGKETLSKNICAIQNHMNILEKNNKWRLSNISEIEIENNKAGLNIILEGSKNYLKSSPLLHLYIAMLRSIVETDQKIKNFNLSTACEYIRKCAKDNNTQLTRETEIKTLEHVGKEKIDKFLFKHHKAIFRKLDLKEIYPKATSNRNYHNLFGIQSFCEGNMYVKTIEDRIQVLFKKHLVKKYE